MKIKSVYALLLTIPILAIIGFGLASPPKPTVQDTSLLTITAQTDQVNYRLRQNAIVSGNITVGGSPGTNLVVAVEVKKPSSYGYYSFRTLQIGNPTDLWAVNITDINIMDMSDNLIDTIKVGSQMQVNMTIHNLQGTTESIFATTTVYDADMAQIGLNYGPTILDPLDTVNQIFQMQVPAWACSGQASMVGCVYSSEPASQGIAYSPEKAYYYYISRTQTGLLGITQPSSQSQNTTGVYTDPVRLPPYPVPGKYSVYVLGQSSPVILSSATTSFYVQSTNGIPPQASFAYWPTNPTVNDIVSFDASSSSPEGYNDIITRYDWNFGDGTPDTIKTGTPADPTASHNFTQAGTHIVTLNVTNNEGLWCTTSKPIFVGLGYGPTANFTWTPQPAATNQSITFDASGSSPGSSSTLTNYFWNFSDGTGIYNVTKSAITHSYAQAGNYTVTLTVLDSLGRNASISATVQVQNFTIKIYDVNGDGKIDGADIAIVAYSFGSFPGSGNWNPVADINHDGKVDGADIAFVAACFGLDP